MQNDKCVRCGLERGMMIHSTGNVYLRTFFYDVHAKWVFWRAGYHKFVEKSTN